MNKEEGLRFVKEFGKKLVNNFALKKLILFGSCARGDFREDSDFDLIVVSDEFERWKDNRQTVIGLAVSEGVEI
jgi:uncharacterized protein